MFSLHGYGPIILEGALLTIQVAIISLGISMFLGILAAVGKLSNSFILQKITQLYTTIIRGVPDLVLMLLIFFGGQVFINWLLQQLGHDDYLDIDPFIAGVSTIGVIYGSYMAETFRGAILAVPAGQLEAGHAYGMTRVQVFLRILAPQMIRHAIPGFGNNWLVLLKGTAIISIIGLDDMVRKSMMAAGATRMPFTFLTVAALGYLIITTVSIIILKWLEDKYSMGVRKA
ncbi:MAG: ABC transporter permease [Desulfobacterales bacterium]|nr:ABC transporter permease [Desulfobacterales bacterium]